MSTSAKGSNATEASEMERSHNLFLSHIIVKLLLWSDGLERLDEQEKETLEGFLLDLNYPEFHG